MGNVWLAGNGPDDHQVLKFSGDGTFLMQIGQAGRTEGSNSTEFLGQPADMEVDPETNELYIADGYLNKRIIVFDADTGEYRRHWGAYGNEPSDEDTGPFMPGADPIAQFRTPVHAVRIAHDGMVYVADRCEQPHPGLPEGRELRQRADRGGQHARERLHLGPGSSPPTRCSAISTTRTAPTSASTSLTARRWRSRPSSDAGGRRSGEFHWVHNLVVDSMGNFYTAEVSQGRRAQKFVVSSHDDDHDHDHDGVPDHDADAH